jgi:hypothetical protein
VAFYAGVAFVLEDVLGRPLLPTFRRGAAAAAVEGGEPGVREQL